MVLSSRLLLLGLLALPTSVFAAPDLTVLPSLSGGRSAQANALSRDGQFVVGTAWTPAGFQAVRWNAATGLQGLGELAGGSYDSQAFAVSRHGEVVVGRSANSESNQIAFRWTEAGGMVGLGAMTSFNAQSVAYAISADGSVVAGGSGGYGFRWTSGTGMVSIGHLSTIVDTEVTAMSADGNVLVGDSRTPGGRRAFRWTSSGGMVDLGLLPNGGNFARAWDVSDDGSVVLGHSGLEVFRWENGVMTALPEFDDTNLAPRAISGDGSIVVGRSEVFLDAYGYLWTAEDGPQDATLLFQNLGILPSGWHIFELTDVSRLTDDVYRVVGNARDANGNWHGFVATVPEPGTLAALGAGALALARRRRKRS